MSKQQTFTFTPNSHDQALGDLCATSKYYNDDDDIVHANTSKTVGRFTCNEGYITGFYMLEDTSAEISTEVQLLLGMLYTV